MAPKASPKPLRVPLSKLFAWKPKIAETLVDVEEGRLSYSSTVPLSVSRLDTPRGGFFVLDGHHRAVEAACAHKAFVMGTLDRYIPRIERTGGAHRDVLLNKGKVLDEVDARRKRTCHRLTK